MYIFTSSCKWLSQLCPSFIPTKCPKLHMCCHVLPVQIMYHAMCPPSYVFPDRGNCQVFNSVDFTHLCSYKWRGFSVDGSDIFSAFIPCQPFKYWWCGMGWTIKQRWLRLGDLIFKEAERNYFLWKKSTAQQDLTAHVKLFLKCSCVFASATQTFVPCDFGRSGAQRF